MKTTEINSRLKISVRDDGKFELSEHKGFDMYEKILITKDDADKLIEFLKENK